MIFFSFSSSHLISCNFSSATCKIYFSLPLIYCGCPLLHFSSNTKVVCMNIECTFTLQLCSPYIVLEIPLFVIVY